MVTLKEVVDQKLQQVPGTDKFANIESPAERANRAQYQQQQQSATASAPPAEPRKCDVDVERIASLIVSGDKAAAQADFDAVCKREKLLDYHAVMMRAKIFKIVNEKKNAAPKNAAPTVSAGTKQAIKMTKTQWLAIGKQAQWDKRLAQVKNCDSYMGNQAEQSARVSYFSFWGRPQHTLCSDSEVQDLVAEGRDRQYGIVVTDATDPEPNEFIPGHGVNDLRKTPGAYPAWKSPQKTAQAAPRPDPFAAWKKALTDAIAKKIDELKADGTTAMSLANLQMVVRPPQGGPGGTNAQYYYKNDWFPNAVKALPSKYRSFILASANVKVLNLKLSQISPKYTKVTCDQCQMMVIQGKPCHETGCPKSHINPVTGQPYPVPCFQCGCDYIPEGKVHRTNAICPDCQRQK